MSIFSDCAASQSLPPVTKGFQIDSTMYYKVKYLQKVYYSQASINALIVAAVDDYLNTHEGVELVPLKNTGTYPRGYTMSPLLYERLSQRSKKYSISINKIANLAVAAALDQETEKLRDFSLDAALAMDDADG